MYPLKLEMDEDWAVVGGMPEIGNVLWIANGFCVVVTNHVGIMNALLECRSNVDEVYARLPARCADELLGMRIVYEVDVWCLFPNEVVNEESGGVVGQLISGVIYAGYGVEIAHHGP